MPASRLMQVSYPTIEAAMLTEHTDLPSADLVVAAGTNVARPLDHEVDVSFAAQMRHLTRCDAVAPQAFLFTAYSSLPVADSLRGFYGNTGSDKPHLDYILAKRKASEGPFDWGKEINDTHQPEILRLANVCQGLAHVCIVDQYIQTGGTAQFAASLVLEATEGRTTVSVMRGDWYHQALASDLRELTSPHATFMRSIGEKAWAAINEPFTNT